MTDNEILIKAAQKNYKTYKVATSFVTAKKVKRYYTAEQQADLDIKTAVNLIGEIVNLSQELNSLLWDKIYYGATYDDVKDLYYDICQLDIMSGIAIDAAKKEFDINLKRELQSIRQKWQSESETENEDGKVKKKLPHFFAHVSKQKGYYNPDKKDYIKYHTAMDYLQTIVNGFRLKHPYKDKLSKTLPFMTVLNSKKFKISDVNQKQINKIYSLLKTYMNRRRMLFAYTKADVDKKELFTQSHLLYDNLISDINSETIGFSTMFRLLTSLESDANRGIKKLLLQVLFLCGNKSFNEAIINSADDIEELSDGGNDIFLFGNGYKITKKTVNPEIKR